MSEVAISEPRSAYLFLRHMCPELTRLLRAVIDVGSTRDELRRIVEKRQHPGDTRETLLAAIDHIIANPQAGAVYWTNDGSYNWAEMRDAKRPDAPEVPDA